jgi:hypothetical protein
VAERPALQRLIRDIEADRVDTVVCYKIDRLSRSLTDFAKLVDVFDPSAAGRARFRAEEAPLAPRSCGHTNWWISIGPATESCCGRGHVPPDHARA